MREVYVLKSSRMKERKEAFVQIPNDEGIITVHKVQFRIHENILELKQRAKELSSLVISKMRSTLLHSTREV